MSLFSRSSYPIGETRKVPNSNPADKVKLPSQQNVVRTRDGIGNQAECSKAQPVQQNKKSDVARAKQASATVQFDHDAAVERQKRQKKPPSSYVRPSKASSPAEFFAEKVRLVEERQKKQDPTWRRKCDF